MRRLIVGFTVFILATVANSSELLPRAGTQQVDTQLDVPETHDNYTVSCCIDLDISIPNEDLGVNVLWIIQGIAQPGRVLRIELPKASENIGNVARFFRVDGSEKTIRVSAAGGSVIYGGSDAYDLDTQYSSVTFAVIDGIGWGVVD